MVSIAVGVRLLACATSRAAARASRSGAAQMSRPSMRIAPASIG